MTTKIETSIKPKEHPASASCGLLGVIWQFFLRHVNNRRTTESALWLAQRLYPTFSALLVAAEQDQQRLNYWDEMSNHRLQEMLSLWRLEGRPEIKWIVSPERDVLPCSFLSRQLNLLNPYFYFRWLTPNEKS